MPAEEVHNLEQLRCAQAALRRSVSLQEPMAEEEFFTTVCRESLALAAAQRASILVPIPGTQNLRFLTHCGQPHLEIENSLVPQSSIAGYAFSSQHMVIVSDVGRDSHFYSGVDEKTGLRTLSLIALPLWRQNKVIGVLEVINRNDGKPFTEQDGLVLRAFGETINLALSAQRQVNYLQTLIEAGKEMASVQESQQLLQELCHAAQKIGRAEAASILLGPDQNGSLQFVAATGPSADKLRKVAVSMDSIAGRSLTSGQPQIINQVDEKAIQAHGIDYLSGFHTKMILAVPIVHQDKKIGVFEVLNKRNGEPFDEEDAFLLRLLAGQAAIAIENVRLQESREQALQELRDLDRRKDKFLAVTSHELRTPLTVIMGYSEFLLSHLKEKRDKEGLMYLKGLAEGTSRLSEIIEVMTSMNNLLQTVVAPGGWSTIDLTELVQQLPLEFQTWIRTKRLDFILEGGTEPVYVRGDAKWLKQAISNLISNAIKFTESGGKVVLAIQPSDDSVQLRVTDTGIGIPPEEQKHIFERFYQVESYLTRQHAGLGLGLSIAQDIVRKHGGEIQVQSELGKGSTFSFVLPRHYPSTASEAKGQLPVTGLRSLLAG